MKLKALVRYPVDIRRAQRLLANKPVSIRSLGSRPVALDLATDKLLFDCGRHFASIAHHCQQTGSIVTLRCSKLLLAAIARKIHGGEMLAMPHVEWVDPSGDLPDGSLVLRDDNCDSSGGAKIQSTREQRGPFATRSLPRNASVIQMMIGRDSIAGTPVMPYPMHPATLPNASPKTLSRIRKQNDRTSRRGIYFAGNQKPKYGRIEMTDKFGVMPRLQILGTLRDSFPIRLVDDPLSSEFQQPIHFSDSQSESITADCWLPTLARHAFFVCCPGAAQPMCHNLIEAMSVGTIPLIEYGDRVTPALTDGVNAIAFAGPDGLRHAIDRIESMTHEQVRAMSRNVCEFYDRFLCGNQFIASLRDEQADCGMVSMPFHDSNMYDASQVEMVESARQQNTPGQNTSRDIAA